jgi:hypothetical protein
MACGRRTSAGVRCWLLRVLIGAAGPTRKGRGLRWPSCAAAACRAFRKGWPRQPGNDGAARVAVPLGEDHPMMPGLAPGMLPRGRRQGSRRPWCQGRTKPGFGNQLDKVGVTMSLPTGN